MYENVRASSSLYIVVATSFSLSNDCIMSHGKSHVPSIQIQILSSFTLDPIAFLVFFYWLMSKGCCGGVVSLRFSSSPSKDALDKVNMAATASCSF